MEKRSVKCRIPIHISLETLIGSKDRKDFSDGSHNLASEAEIETYALENGLDVDFVTREYQRLSNGDFKSDMSQQDMYGGGNPRIFYEIASTISMLFDRHLAHYELRGIRSIFVSATDYLPTKEVYIDPKQPDINPHDVYYIRIPIDYEKFSVLSNIDKKKEVLRLIMLGIRGICEQFTWAIEPFEAAAHAIEEVGYTFEGKVVKPKWLVKHPTRKLKAGLGVTRDVGRSELFLFVADDEHNELYRKVILEKVNLELEFTRYAKYTNFPPEWQSDNQVILPDRVVIPYKNDEITGQWREMTEAEIQAENEKKSYWGMLTVPEDILNNAGMRKIKPKILKDKHQQMSEEAKFFELFESYRYKEGADHKFWRIRVANGEVLLNYGKVGTVGRFQFKEILPNNQFIKEIEKLTQGVVKKGYILEEKVKAEDCVYLDIKEKGLHPLTTHPKFLKHFTADFYLSETEECSPFASKSMRAALRYWEEDVRKYWKFICPESPAFNPDPKKLRYFGALSRPYGHTLPTVVTREDVEGLLNENDGYVVMKHKNGSIWLENGNVVRLSKTKDVLLEGDQAVYGRAFAYIKVEGNIALEWKQLGIYALKRMCHLYDILGKNYNIEIMNQMIADLENFKAIDE